MTEQNKDYSKLRPFDLEAVKRGEPICWFDNAERVKFMLCSGDDGEHCVSMEDGNLALACFCDLRMAPLAWVEGKPVYRGDVLFSHTFHDKHPKGLLITGKHPNDYLSWKSIGNGRTSIDGYGFFEFTWNPPKVKREVKLLAYLDSRNLYWVREGTTTLKDAVRVPFEDKTVEVIE